MSITLAEALSITEPKLKDLSCRLQPTSFTDVGNKIQAFPQPFDWQWASLKNLLMQSESRLVMTCLPVFWQTTTLVNAVCRELQIPIIVNRVNDWSVGAAAVGLGVDAVITTAKEAPSFFDYLREHGRPLPALWFLLHELGADGFRTPTTLVSSVAQTANEIHLFPGVPVLVQCPQIVSHRKAHFHICQDFMLMAEENNIVVGQSGGLLPEFSHKLPFSLTNSGICSCGKPLYSISL